ncbi:MAG: SUF system NifU family Fe-S cluster assembly protein [Bdellovibrionales bacterium]|nr:SUF system NifU family Fe-S cluster assembly protein [Bdellovibrionales bacterium]
MSLDELYQEVILDHFKHPRCHGCPENADSDVTLNNPLCGDVVQVGVQIDDQTVKEVGFSGSGCAISQASASIMTELVKGKSRAEIQELADKFQAMMRGEIAPEELVELGDAVVLEGVRKFSARVKCAVLAWEALQKCLELSKDASDQ